MSPAEVVGDLDRVCLLLCFALLDYTLRGDHFESVVLNFLGTLVGSSEAIQLSVSGLRLVLEDSLYETS
jgi:hypothetical protein